MKNQPQYILHIGSVRINCLKIVQGDDHVARIAAYSTCPADGFDRGAVKDLSRASESLKGLFARVLEGESETMIRARVVISHPFIKNCIFGSSMYFYGNPHAITIRDVREVIAQTRSVATIPLNEMIVQAVPQEFLVNDLAAIANPIGLEATRLGVTLRLFTMDYTICYNLLRAMERCDIDPIDFIPVSLAAAQGVLSREEKEEGVLLIDVGGYSIRCDSYRKSILYNSETINQGSEQIVEEVAEKLNLKTDDARQLVETYCSATPNQLFSDELVPIKDQEETVVQHINKQKLNEVSRHSIQALVDSIIRIIEKSGQQSIPLSQIVFTGGGAKMDGLLDNIQAKVSQKVRLGVPKNFQNIPQKLNDSAFSDLIGAINYSTLVRDPDLYSPPLQNAFAKVVDSAKRWVSEYF